METKFMLVKMELSIIENNSNDVRKLLIYNSEQSKKIK